MKFDYLYEKIYNILNKNKRSVIYAAPGEDELHVEKILKFIENNTLLATELNELNSKQDISQQNILSFLRKVIKTSYEQNQLLDIPQSVWDSLRDYNISRISGLDIHDALEPAWPNGPSTIEAFDELMNQRHPDVRLPFKAYFDKQYKKGLGKEHVFHRQRAEAEQQKQDPNKAVAPENGAAPSLA